MHLHSVYIKNIKQANENDRLAIFVGAGVSKSSDSDYRSLPLWSDLMSELKSDLAITEDLDYLKLAQLYYLEFGEQTYNQVLRKYFPEDITPSSLHRTILEVNPRVILTTNWDCIIENAIEQEGYLYDKICTDKDLVSSASPNKIIKIHGDFKNHNVVFKEDDYLNYSRNFPLIENYIKSIFSTHTVLFLGYSYNDINLKHIMKWMQSHSNSAPPMYLVNFKSDKPQESYLSNHGITTLVLDGENYSIDDVKNLDKRSALTQSFLTSIIKDDGEVDVNDEQDVIGFIYERIKHLKKLNSITHNQIRGAITNCGFRYDSDGLNVLELFKPKGVLTTDCSDSTRSIHEKFLEILARIDSFGEDEKDSFYRRNSKLTEILSILALAHIKGVVLPEANDNGRIVYFLNEKIDSAKNLEESDRKYISFSESECKSNDYIKYLSSGSYESYKLGEYEVAFKKNSELILACKRHKIYSILLIALFNKNSILWRLKYSFSNKNRSDFEKEVEVKLQDEFFKFPRSEIKRNQALYDFLALHSVHQKANDCTKKILDLTRAVESIKAGGISFNNYADEPTCTHINLLMFSLKNHIMIDQYAPYKAVMRDFVNISILRQSVKKIVKLNQYEIYSAIQFYPSKELQSELRVFFKSEDSNQLRLSASGGCLEWVVFTVLPKLTGQLVGSLSLFDGYESKFENCVRLLAVLNLSDAQVSNVMREFSRLIASDSTAVGTYEAINEFLAHQYELFDRDIETDILINILNTVIDKIISKTAHGWDQHAILNGSIGNLYGYIGVVKGEYTDKVRARRLVFELESYKSEEQRKFSKSLLYSIFKISDESVRNIIKAFIKVVISQSKTKGIDDWEFELWSFAVGFKDFDAEAISRLDEYLVQFRDGKIFSSQLYSLKNLTQYLINEKEVDALEGLNEELGDLIDQYEQRPNLSSI
ncbi:SIR2 family protein [Gilvimarinus sp. SDUM040013]|uniref:SIR2 family protein n=1 Tax=Gilvimarinus gilvus TaxID=3058038 RepID=A0ABU4RYL1_9GAMM|nr:SIR2 family protein [Gilvimarinus sp. SDUM040013]MDO3386355.1 SIR2 family protein [Gilvimarinus sp. SDUM040013]MDX6849987.1 SIR2 family protein [Gilvimarinus sp. SDUM040013]